MEETMSAKIKKAITRTEWTEVIEGTWKRDQEPHQGPPSKGTAEPPLGEGLRAPTPNDQKHNKTASNHQKVQVQKKKQKKHKKTGSTRDVKAGSERNY